MSIFSRSTMGQLISGSVSYRERDSTAIEFLIWVRENYDLQEPVGWVNKKSKEWDSEIELYRKYRDYRSQELLNRLSGMGSGLGDIGNAQQK